jgi:hypothetical protein
LTGEPIPTPVTSWKLILSTREDFPNVAPPSAKAKARKSPTLQAMTARATAQSLKFLFFISSQTVWAGATFPLCAGSVPSKTERRELPRARPLRYGKCA